MKISQINFFQNKNIFLKNKKQNYVSFKSSPDSVEFSSKETNKPNKRFLDLVADEEMQQKIVNNLFINSDDVYDREMENKFISFTSKFIHDYKESDDNDHTLDLINSAYMAFKFLKGDGKGLVSDNDAEKIAFACASAMSNELSPDAIENIMSTAKTKDNKPSIKLFLSLIDYTVKRNCNLSATEAISELSRFCLNENGEIDEGLYNKMAKLFNISRVHDISMVGLVHDLVLDKDKNIDEDRYTFVYETMEKLFNTLDEELIYYDVNIYEQFIMSIYVIVFSIVNMSKDSDDNFDIQKARKSFNDWFSYSKKFPELLNKRMQINVTIAEDGIPQNIVAPFEKLNSTIPQVSRFFNNSIYRMLFLLGGSNAFSSDKIN